MERALNLMITKSITDPDSGLLNRPGKPNAFCYLNHQTCDSENGIITDVFVTPGNVSDNVPHTARIECQINKFDFHTKAICADAGYDSPEIYTAMSKAGIKSYIPIGSTGTPQKSIDGKLYDNTEFIYDRNEDIYICPNGKTLAYSSYRKGRGRKRYISKSSDCKSCPLKEKCIGNRQKQKTIDRLLHSDILQEQRDSIDTTEYDRAMRLRQIWCEGNFAHQKEQHNLRRTFKRGIEKVTEQWVMKNKLCKCV